MKTFFYKYKSDIDDKRNFDATERERLWETKEHICGICGGEIVDISLMDVNHVKRYCDGGKTDLDNAELTHQYCNRAN